MSADNFFQALQSHWIPLPPGIQESFLSQTKEFVAIENRLKEDTSLASYDQQIYPELCTVLGMTIITEPTPPTVVLHFCNNQLQLMANVFLALNLARYHAHPLNRGWMNLFRRWTATPTMRLLWPSLKSTYSRDFVAFAEYHLNLPEVPPLVIKKESVPLSQLAELFALQDPSKAAGLRPSLKLVFNELRQEWPMSEYENANEQLRPAEQERTQATALKEQMKGAKEKPYGTGQEVYAQYFEPFLHATEIKPSLGATEIKMWTISHPSHAEEIWGIALLGPHPDSLPEKKQWREYLPKGVKLQRLMVWIRPAFRGVCLGTNLLNAVFDEMNRTESLGLIVVLPPLRRNKSGYRDEMAGWLRFYGRKGFVRTTQKDAEQILTRPFDCEAFCLVMPELLKGVPQAGSSTRHVSKGHMKTKEVE